MRLTAAAPPPVASFGGEGTTTRSDDGTGFAVGVLGPLEVRHGGSVLALPTPKERTMLALLALRVPHGVSFAELADALWGEAPPGNWRKGIQVHASRLRSRLTDGADGDVNELLVTVGDGYRLALDPDAVDAHRFERLLGEGRRALAEGRPADADHLLSDALSLWRSDPVPDLIDTSTGQAQAARLLELLLVTREERYEAELALGRHDVLVPRIEARLVDHPLRERMWRQLMTALYRSGRQAEALRAYQRARTVLVDELGLEPGPELRRIEAAIVAQDADLELVDLLAVEPAVATVAPEPHTGSLAWASRLRNVPFVGRAEARQRLRRAYHRAGDEGLCVLVLSGEEGVGKTRLMAETVLELPSDDSSILAGWCTRDSSESFAAVRQVLGRFTDGDPPSATDSYAVTAELTGRLRAIAAHGPVVLLVDDLQWADHGTIQVLRSLLASARDLPVLLIAAYRDTEIESTERVLELLVDLHRHPAFESVHLRGLAPDEGVELLAHRLGRPAEDASRVELATLCQEAGGNPLYLLELARRAVDRAVLDPEGNVVAGSVKALGLPESLRVMIRRRVRALPPEHQPVLSAAAVAGTEFDIATVAAVAGVTEEEAISAIERAIAAGLVIDSGEPGRGAFASVLVRVALYEELSSSRRAMLHQRTGELLALGGADEIHERLPAVTDHFAQARAPAKRSGPAPSDDERRERYASAYEEAVSQFEESLTGSIDLADGDQWCGLLLGLATGRWRSGDLAGARELFERAASEAKRLGRADLLTRAAAGAAQVVLKVGVTHPPLIDLLNEARDQLPDDDPLYAQIRKALVPELVWAGRWREAVIIAGTPSETP